jgi:hypothetical protein
MAIPIKRRRHFETILDAVCFHIIIAGVFCIRVFDHSTFLGYFVSSLLD